MLYLKILIEKFPLSLDLRARLLQQKWAQVLLAGLRL